MTPEVPAIDVVHAAARSNAPHEPPPTCSRCELEMNAGELRAARRLPAASPGEPAIPVVVLPIWTCTGCGCRQPRLDF